MKGGCAGCCGTVGWPILELSIPFVPVVSDGLGWTGLTTVRCMQGYGQFNGQAEMSIVQTPCIGAQGFGARARSKVHSSAKDGQNE